MGAVRTTCLLEGTSAPPLSSRSPINSSAQRALCPEQAATGHLGALLRGTWSSRVPQRELLVFKLQWTFTFKFCLFLSKFPSLNSHRRGQSFTPVEQPVVQSDAPAFSQAEGKAGLYPELESSFEFLFHILILCRMGLLPPKGGFLYEGLQAS